MMLLVNLLKFQKAVTENNWFKEEARNILESFCLEGRAEKGGKSLNVHLWYVPWYLDSSAFWNYRRTLYTYRRNSNNKIWTKKDKIERTRNIKPYLAIQHLIDLSDDEISNIKTVSIPDDSTNHPSSVRSQDIIFHWENLVLSNISSNTCIISYIKINHSPYAFPIKSPLKSGEIFQITGNLMAIYIFPVIDSITLGVYDSNFNLYEYPLHFRLVDCPAEQKSKLPNIEKVIEFDTIDCQPDLLK